MVVVLVMVLRNTQVLHRVVVHSGVRRWRSWRWWRDAADLAPVAAMGHHRHSHGVHHDLLLLLLLLQDAGAGASIVISRRGGPIQGGRLLAVSGVRVLDVHALLLVVAKRVHGHATLVLVVVHVLVI